MDVAIIYFHSTLIRLARVTTFESAINAKRSKQIIGTFERLFTTEDIKRRQHMIN